ncbi:hypothetical protein E2C01_096052 [Portunus trituberculatus]|uniref:Uncharacterized protein n=1 Tax=Portunus trituberculatus TaxID=210409 RepID=A0A5B7JUL8_PORTR|nr:hypothetical protein [Portunus trituberculatus]
MAAAVATIKQVPLFCPFVINGIGGVRHGRENGVAVGWNHWNRKLLGYGDSVDIGDKVNRPKGCELGIQVLEMLRGTVPGVCTGR